MINKYSLSALIWIFSVLLIACNDDTEENQEPSDNPPVETLPANTTYKPAFEGQTRIGAVVTGAGYEKQIITQSLSSPWGVKTLPDGRILVTEKEGKIRIVTTAGVVSNPITGIPAVNPAGQGGLLGLCLDPDFASNRMLYWVFSEALPAGNVTAVAKGRLSDDDKEIESATVIYRSNTPYAADLHYGGRVLFDNNGYLIVSTGERSDLVTRPLAQAVNSSLGKTVRITKEGNAAPGNPSFTGSGALPELYTIGHRNPQGLAVHPETGDIWEVEHGPRGGDELNRLQPGLNYGWPTITYGIEYTGEPIGDAIQQQNGLEQPVYYWDPVVSPSGITFYSGRQISEWKNNLFLSSLSGKHIVRIVLNNNNRVVGEERLLESEGQRFRDITEGNDGALYAISDEGRLYRIGSSIKQ